MRRPRCFPLAAAAMLVAAGWAAGAPAASAAWGVGGSGLSKATAARLTTPTVTAKSTGCNGNNRITLTLSSQPIGAGRVEVVRSTTSGGGSFASPYATLDFSANPPEVQDNNAARNTTYYYRVRVLTPSGTSWVGPASAELEARCSN